MCYDWTGGNVENPDDKRRDLKHQQWRLSRFCPAFLGHLVLNYV